MPTHTLAIDLDGTLIDTVGMLFDSFDAFVRASRAPAIAAASCDGLTVPGIIERVRAAAPDARQGSSSSSFDAAAAAYIAALDDIYTTRALAHDGVDEALRAFAAAGVRLWLVTSAEERYTTPLLARMGWTSLFARVEHATSGRPKEAIFRELRGVDAATARHAHHVTVVEDSEAGVRAAVRAGVPAVGVGARAERRSTLWQAGAFFVAEHARDALAAAHHGAGWLAEATPRADIDVDVGVDVDVEVIVAPARSDAAAEVVRGAWMRALEKNPSLFDGPILAVHDVTFNALTNRACVRASQASYRDYLASHEMARDPHLAPNAEVAAELRVRPLGVTGVVRSGSRIVIGKRSADSSSFAGAWELPPSGSVEGATGLERQWLRELHEELAIDVAQGSTGAAQAPVCPAGILSSADGTIDVVFIAEFASDVRVNLPARTREYSELRWMDVAELAAWASSPSVDMVPASRLLARMQAERTGRA